MTFNDSLDSSINMSDTNDIMETLYEDSGCLNDSLHDGSRDGCNYRLTSGFDDFFMAYLLLKIGLV